MKFLYDHLGNRPQVQVWIGQLNSVGNRAAVYKSDGMGCDIHAYCEYRESESAPWKFLRDPDCNTCKGTGKLMRPTYSDDDDEEEDKPRDAPIEPRKQTGEREENCYYCDGKGKQSYHYEDSETGEPVDPSTGNGYWYGGNVYRGRNYGLFSILNDAVRNYSHYQGIIPERGIPEDRTEEYFQLADNGDAHSHSWLNYDELNAAMVHGEHHFANLPDNEEHYVVTKEFVTGTLLHTLKPLAEKYGGANVRMVFFFDN